MGDFEDVFGAGADAVDIIEMHNRQYLRELRQEKSRDLRSIAGAKAKAGSEGNELELWRTLMLSRGYLKGPRFSSFEELSEWERENARPHVRRRTPFGFEVFYTK